MSASGMIAPVKRACDSCHRRKVKCIGEGVHPCKNCAAANLACTYNAIPQKKGPKGSRAKVLTELRENQRNAQLVTALPAELGFDGRLQQTFARTPGLLPLPLIESCCEFYLRHIYPTQPVLSRHKIHETLLAMERSTEAYCLLVALCAYGMIQANMPIPSNVLPRPEMAQMSNMTIGQFLLDEAIRVRKGHDYFENPTHLSVVTSYLMYGSCFGLGRDKSAWLYLREATTQAQLMNWHDEEAYRRDSLDTSHKRVLYWLLLLAERTHALHKHQPITLFPTVRLPSLGQEAIDRPVTLGLDHMIKLFKPIDHTFINLWNKVHSRTEPTWISHMQNEISKAIPSNLNCTESQDLNLRITQQWLRTILWQLSVSQGHVSSVATDPTLTFTYPIEVSRELLSITSRYPRHAMELQGAGLMEKIFDIACCLTDVVACVPFTSGSTSSNARDLVSRMISLFTVLRDGQTRYLQLLIAKVSDVLPDIPLSQGFVNPHSGAHASSAASSFEATGPNWSDHLAAQFASAVTIHPSTDFIRQLAAQTGAHLPSTSSQHHTMQQTAHSMQSARSYRESAHGHRPSTSGSASHSASVDPYNARMQNYTHHPAPSHGHSSHQTSRHTPMQNSHISTSPTSYNPRYAVQGYASNTSMSLDGSSSRATAGMQMQGSTAYPPGVHASPSRKIKHGRDRGSFAA